MVIALSEPEKGEPYRGIVWFDAKENSYSIAEHNLGSDYQAIIERHRNQGLPAYVFEHRRRHNAEPAEKCRGCDRIVRKTFDV